MKETIFVNSEVMHNMGKALFIAGTGTDVGKTYAAGLIVKKLSQSGASAAYYKAAVSGNVRGGDGKLIPGDALYVKTVSGICQPLEQMCPYVYEHAVSPHLAAGMEGNPVRMDRVLALFKDLCGTYEYVTMEGSGGILCPIRFDGTEIWLADIVKACGAGCLLVADAGLGAINAAGLTAFYMREKGIPLKGIILNHFRPGDGLHEDNRKMCEYVTGVKVAACIKDGDRDLELSGDCLKALYEEVLQ